MWFRWVLTKVIELMRSSQRKWLWNQRYWRQMKYKVRRIQTGLFAVLLSFSYKLTQANSYTVFHSANTDCHKTYVYLHLACWKASSCTKLPCRQNRFTAFTCGGICKSEISCGGMQVCFRPVEEECQSIVAANFTVVSEYSSSSGRWTS